MRGRGRERGTDGGSSVRLAVGREVEILHTRTTWLTSTNGKHFKYFAFVTATLSWILNGALSITSDVTLLIESISIRK